MYIPFNIKTDYSLMYSMIKIKDLISYAKKNNLKALTITDDNLFGSIEFYNECRNNNIKPIIGLDIKINGTNIILYALNYEGYTNLIKISSLYREKSKVDLEKLNKGILCIVPFNSLNLYEKLEKIFKEIYISYKDESEKSKINNPNKLYMNEILYLEEKDLETYKYFRSYRKTYSDDDYDNYLKLNVEDNSAFYDKFNLEIKKHNSLLPHIDNNYEVLKEKCKVGFKKRFGHKVGSKYIERLKRELETINKMNYADYFLIVSDYVRFAKENNILVGPGRGSAVGSLVSYVLEITDIDPLKYGLLFERFLNESRVTMPDIDIDFDALRREEVIKYCINKYGLKNVAGVITFSSLSLKQAIKELAPLLEIEEQDTNYLINLIDMNALSNLVNNDKLKYLYNIALKLEGIKTNISVNASGIVICRYELDNFVPLEKHNDMYLIGHTMNYLEQIGLLKMDFLALKNLTLIADTIKGINIDINNIPLDDKETLELFNKVNTLGIFQFDTFGMKDVLRKFKIDTFADVYNLSALFRPGPKDNINSYIKRKSGKEKIEYIDPSLEDILKSTYGIIIYQEQIMKIANVMANYTICEADNLRRAMSKKNEAMLIKEKEKFINQAVTNGYTIEVATKTYNYILKFASYGFNKSHSVAYAKIAYQMAYLKTHYKELFMKNLLEDVPLNSLKEYIIDCKNNNIKLITPNINISSNTFEVNDGIILPFKIIKNINYAVITNILDNRTSRYEDIFDFLIKVDTKLINKDILIILIKAGCFDDFETRKTLIDNIDVILNYINLYKELGGMGAIKPIINKFSEYSKKELSSMEYEVFGFYINNNPVLEYRKEHNLKTSLSSLASYINKRIEIIVCINSIKEINTKDHKKMCFIRISDNYTIAEATVFSEEYKLLPKLKPNDIVLIKGKVSRRDGKDQIIVNSVELI